MRERTLVKPEIHCIVVGPLQSNCFLVADRDSLEALIIDPGSESNRILEKVESLGLRVTGIVLTHAHGDHIGAVGLVKSKTQAPVMVHREEADWLTDPEKNLSARLGFPIVSPPADRLLEEGDQIEFGQFRLSVLHTPGHSPGAITLSGDGYLISGDLIFEESVGRTDLPGGDMEHLAQSIRNKIYTRPDETVIYPGHGSSTTVGHEKKYNPFVRP